MGFLDGYFGSPKRRRKKSPHRKETENAPSTMMRGGHKYVRKGGTGRDGVWKTKTSAMDEAAFQRAQDIRSFVKKTKGGYAVYINYGKLKRR